MSVGTHVTVVQMLPFGVVSEDQGTLVISSSESSVNNWWESDCSMKGIYQGNEFDVEGPPCKKIHAIITETVKKSLAPTEDQMVMPKLHYTMTAHGFQDILIVSIYWDLMVIIFQIYFHLVRSPST